MRKDIIIPKVTNVYIVAVHEWDKDFLAQNWVVYLVNQSDRTLETTLIMSRGNDSDRKTSTLRHGLNNVAPKTVVKVELLPDEVLGFTNECVLTFFADGKLYDRTYVFKPHSVEGAAVKSVPNSELEGVFAS